MDSLEALICYFLSQRPGIGRVMLQKLVYLFEYYHTLSQGSQFTQVRFIRYKHGPFAQQVHTAVENCNIINKDVYYGPNGVGYAYILNGSGIKLELPSQQQPFANFVLKITSEKNLDDVIDFVYRTPPMANILLVESAVSNKMLKEELDMTARETVPVFSKDKILAAKERNKERVNMGSNEQYFANLLSEYRELEPLRERATRCQTSK